MIYKFKGVTYIEFGTGSVIVDISKDSNSKRQAVSFIECEEGERGRRVLLSETERKENTDTCLIFKDIESTVLLLAAITEIQNRFITNARKTKEVNDNEHD